LRLLRKHPETYGLSCFLPAALLLGLLVGPAVTWTSRWLALGYGGFVGLYAALLVVVSLAVSVRAREIRLFPRLLLVYAAIHLGAGAGVLLEAVTGAKRRRVSLQRPSLSAQLERRAA